MNVAVMLLFGLLLSDQYAVAGDIQGASLVCPNQSNGYSFTSTSSVCGPSQGPITNYSWSVSGGTILSGRNSSFCRVSWSHNDGFKSISVTIRRSDDACGESGNLSVSLRSEVLPASDPANQANTPPQPELSGQNFCEGETINLSLPGYTLRSNYEIQWQYRPNAVADWDEFAITNNGTTNTSFTIPDLTGSTFPVAISFRAVERNIYCRGIQRSSTPVIANVFPAPPTMTFGTSGRPTCPNGSDAQINIASIDGGLETYDFTVCRLVPCSAGDAGAIRLGGQYFCPPVSCTNFTRTQPVADWRNNGYNITSADAPISAGWYEVTAEPSGTSDLCFAREYVQVLPALPLTVSQPTTGSPTCIGGNDGSITVPTSRGLGPFTYEAFTTQDFSGSPVPATVVGNQIRGLSAGTYYIRVRDNCSPANQVAYWGMSTSGTAVVITDPTNGFRIDNAQGIPILCATESSPTGTATVSILNRSGNVNFQLLDDMGMEVEASGFIAANSHTFSRQHAIGNYTVRVTDQNSPACSDTEAVTIGGIAALNLNAADIDIVCRGANDGQITITGIGGSSNYQYSIDGGANWFNNNVFPGLSPGDYTPAVRDANVNAPFPECSFVSTMDVTISEPTTSLSIDNVSITRELECFGDSDGRLLVAVSGGTPGTFGYTFSIFDGAALVETGDGLTSYEFRNLYSADFSIVVVDGNGSTFGCTDNTTFFFPQPDELGIVSATPLVYVGGNNIRCFDEDNGEITVITEGGIYPHDVTIDGITQTINADGESTTFTGLVADTYTIAVEDANRCLYEEDITLTEPEELLIDETTLLTYIGDNNISCNGEADGEVTVTTMGGILPHQVVVNGETMEINASTPSVTFTGLSAGTYSVDITDANGCTDTRGITLTEPELFEVASIDIPTFFGGFNLRCNGDDDATSTVVTTGGIYPHDVTVNGVTITLNAPGEQATFTDLIAGTYDVDIVDVNGCANNTSFEITEPDVLQLDDTQTVIVQPECFGDNTASLTLQAMGGVLVNGVDYHYEIDHLNLPNDLPFVFDAHQELDGINVTFDELIAGQYQITVFDHFGVNGRMGGCVFVDTVEITTVNQLVIDIQSTDITCKGDLNGTASISLSGGTAPYTVIWLDEFRQAIETDVVNDGELGLLENRGEGLYFLRISDASGCEYYQAGLNFSIEGPLQPLELVANKRDINCFGDNNGLVQLQASGGWQEQPYLYGTDLANLGVTNTFFEDLAPGTYRYYVQDSRGCIDSVDVEIIEPALLTLGTVQVDNISCNGGNDGLVLLDPQGGRTPYQFSVDGASFQSSSLFDSLVAGTYNFTVRDSSNCEAFLSVTLTEPSPLTVDVINIVDTRCSENGGSAESQVSGGTPPYIYRWTDSNDNLLSSTTTIDQLFGGDYQLAVEDDNGCITIVPFEVLNTNDIMIEVAQVTPVSCFGGSDGAIDITVLESTPPLNIIWSNGATTEDVSGLSAGTYTVTFSDAAGCEVTETIEITSPEAIGLTVTNNQIPTCFEGCDGALTVEPFGGVAPYTYLWPDEGEISSTVTGKCAGSYTVIVTDSNGCTYEETITIEEAAPIEIGLGGSSTICEGQTVELDAGDWQTYSWTGVNGFTSDQRMVTLTDGGQYTLQVTDTDGCVGTESFEVIISNDLLAADFLMPSEGFVGDTVVCIDISWPIVDGITWDYDQSAFNAKRAEGPYLDLELLQEGTHTVSMEAFLGGCEDIRSYDIVVRPASEKNSVGGRFGGQEEGVKVYSLYPNPNQGSFQVDVELHQAGDIHLQLVSVTGDRVWYEYFGRDNVTYSIDVSVDDAPPGVYLLSLETPEESRVLRLFIE